MRTALLLIVLGACTDPLPTSTGSLSSDPAVAYAHALVGFANHGAADRTYTIALTPTDGCTIAGLASMEIDLLANGSALTPSTIPIRTTDVPDTLPSALWMSANDAATGGMITITEADAGRISGSAAITTTTGTITSTFSALVCP